MKTNGHNARLMRPYVRRDGVLQPASWGETLDRAAQLIRECAARRGPDTFGLFSCSKATNEVNYTAQKFARVAVGSNNIDSCNRT
jgi:formate dehydrogenase major subunit